ncbi:hypothetical protein BDR07DRAFT_1344780 [Suillus spraguei]|nr:hypothetical protein BDR07DRAFT_1344780 [Suillus spraguei]
MATKPGGRPLNTLIENNFKKGNATSAKSNRYWWTCNYCNARINGRNNNLFEHLTDAVKCSNRPQETRREALQHLMKKPGGEKVAPMASTAILGGDEGSMNASSSSPLVVESGVVAPVRKRKKTTLDGFVDHPLTKDQKAGADIKFLRFFIHANIPFYAGGDFYLRQFLNEIRPSYTAPSRYVLSHNLLDSEAAIVKLEEIDRLKSRRLLTLSQHTCHGP